MIQKGLKKLTVFALIITMIFSSTSVFAASEATISNLTETLITKIVELQNPEQFIHFARLLKEVDNPSQLADVYEEAYNKLLASQKGRIEGYGVTVNIVKAIINDYTVNEQQLEDGISGERLNELSRILSSTNLSIEEKKSSLRVFINQRKDTLNDKFSSYNVTDEMIVNGTSKLDEMFTYINTLSGQVKLNNAAFIIKKTDGSLELDATKFNDKFIEEANKILKNEIDSKDKIIEALNVFVDYYNNSTNTTTKNALFTYLNGNGFIVSSNTNSGGSGSGSGTTTTNTTTTTTTEDEKCTFEDIAKYDWAKEAIEALASKGIIKGRSEKIFDPAANITRADFVTLIARMLKIEAESGETNFTDVNKEQYYAKAIAGAFEAGIIKGKSATTFEPNTNITRQEAAVVISNVLKHLGNKTETTVDVLKDVKDIDKIASWAKLGVATTYKEEIIKGKPGNLFDPDGLTTRAETAVMVYRLLSKIK